MKRLWGIAVATLAALLLAACGSDQDLDKSITAPNFSVFVDRFGERSITCPVGSEDRSTVDLRDFHGELFTGKVLAVVSVDASNCYRIGGKVEPLSQVEKDLPENERIYLQVLKVEIVSVQQIQVEHAEAMEMELNDLKALVWSKVEQAKMLGAEPRDLVINFTFLKPI